MQRSAVCLVAGLIGGLAWVLSVPQAAAIGFCEDLESASFFKGYSEKLRQVAVHRIHEHCEETEEGELRESYGWIDILDHRGKLVRRFINDDSTMEAFNRRIAKRAPVGPKRELAAYLKDGAFTKPDSADESPGGRCKLSLHPLPPESEREEGLDVDAYLVRMKVVHGKDTVLWSRLMEAEGTGDRLHEVRTWFLPGLRMLVAQLEVPYLKYGPSDDGDGEIVAEPQARSETRVFPLSRHEKLGRCFPPPKAEAPPKKKAAPAP